MPLKCKIRERERQLNKYQQIKHTKPFTQKCWSLKGKAKERGIPFDLTPDYLESVWTGHCYISGMPITLWTNRRDEHHAELDKIRPHLGYTQGNVAWISRRFNRLKSDGSAEEHQMIADQLRKEYGQRGGNEIKDPA